MPSKEVLTTACTVKKKKYTSTLNMTVISETKSDIMMLFCLVALVGTGHLITINMIASPPGTVWVHMCQNFREFHETSVIHAYMHH